MTYLTHQGHEVSTTCGSGWVQLALTYLDATNDPPATAGGTDFMLKPFSYTAYARRRTRVDESDMLLPKLGRPGSSNVAAFCSAVIL
jgi:hypothetical protein